MLHGRESALLSVAGVNICYGRAILHIAGRYLANLFAWNPSLASLGP